MRRRRWADSVSLKAIAKCGGLGPVALGDLRPQPDRGDVDSIGLVRRCTQCSAGQPKKRQQFLRILGDLGGGPGELGPHAAAKAFTAAPTWFLSSAILWNRQRWGLACGKTSRTALQNPSAPSPIASTGARMPRRAQSRSRSAAIRRTPGTRRRGRPAPCARRRARRSSPAGDSVTGKVNPSCTSLRIHRFHALLGVGPVQKSAGQAHRDHGDAEGRRRRRRADLARL